MPRFDFEGKSGREKAWKSKGEQAMQGSWGQRGVLGVARRFEGRCAITL